ncbi:unnamed protein product [Arctogadus glacialis]
MRSAGSAFSKIAVTCLGRAQSGFVEGALELAYCVLHNLAIRQEPCRNSPDQTALCLTQCPYHQCRWPSDETEDHADILAPPPSALLAHDEGTMDGPGSSDSSSTMGLAVKETNSH